MDSVQKQLLYCLAAYKTGAAQAQTVPGLTAEDWQALRQLASIHKMGPMVFETLWQAPEFCGGDKRAVQIWRRDTMIQAAGQAMRSAKIVEITGAMEAAGIRYALLKGLVCRELYTRPDLRPSGDEDVLIDPADRERCSAVLQQCGCEMFMGDDTVTHWNEKSSGLHIELHTRLFPAGRSEDEARNQQYMQQLQHTVPCAVPGGTVQTLAPTWHFAFLICHALKHFLTGGVGIRTLCDMIRFAEQYQDEIDISAADTLLHQVNGRIFWDQVMALGEQWLSFDLAGAGWKYSCRPDPEELLLDCLDAGIYGQSSMSRKHSAELVLQAQDDSNAGRHLGSVLFPPRKNMLRRYPELERWPVLLPVCWVRRLATYAGEVLHSRQGNSPLESMALGRKRTAMMVKYGVFEEGKQKK